MKLLLTAMATAMFFLAGCNTFEGFGRDVERGGEKIQNKAGDARR